MKASLLVALIIAVIAVVFALQNPQLVEVRLGPLDVEGSAALLILTTFVLGVGVGILAALPTIWRKQQIIKQFKKASGHPQGAAYREPERTTGADIEAPPDDRAGASG